MSYITDLIGNKGQTDKPCLEVVGDENGLAEMANIWDRNAQLLHIIGINEFIEWTANREFTDKELAAFQEGLAALPNFIEKCYLEKKKSELLTEAKSRQAT